MMGRKCIDYIEGFEEFYDFIDKCESHAEYVIWELRLLCTHPDQPWGPPSLLYSGYRVSFLGVKQPGHGSDLPPPVVPRLRKEVAVPLLPLWYFMACSRVYFTFMYLSI